MTQSTEGVPGGSGATMDHNRTLSPRVKPNPVLSPVPHSLPLGLEVLGLTCISISPDLFDLAGDLQGLPGCILCPLGIGSGTAQGFFCLLGLVTGALDLLADVEELLHGLFGFCFSVFDLQVKF